METYRILSLEIEGVKKISIARIKPDGSLVIIAGENGTGKSSVLDSIEMALDGKRAIPPEPVNRGRTKGKVRINLGPYLITRTFTRKGGGSLKIEREDGKPISSPQKFLDDLHQGVCADPVKFLRADPKIQSETLRALDTSLDFTVIDNDREATYDNRTMKNRELKSLKARLEAAPFHADAPDKEISVAALSEQIEAADLERYEAQKLKGKAERKVTELEDKQRTLLAISRKTEDLENQLSESVKAQEEWTEAIEKLTSEVEELQEVAEDAMEDLTDCQPIRDKIGEAEALNRKWREVQEHRRIGREVEEAEGEAYKMTSKIEEIDAEKSRRIQEATFPVPGLSVDENGVTFNGLPLLQASSAEQLRVSVAVSLAKKTRLRVILIRDGSLLGAEAMELLEELAEEHDAQVWIERVGDLDEGAIVMENGEVRAA